VSKLRVLIYFTHHSSPHWPSLSVYYRKGGKYVVSDYNSDTLRGQMEGVLDGKT